MDSTPKLRRAAPRSGDENAFPVTPACGAVRSPKELMSPSPASSRKKVLGERNGPDSTSMAFKSSPVLARCSEISPSSRKPTALPEKTKEYDPKVNYTTPRPVFLRYNPDRLREILKRMEAEFEIGSSSPSSVASEASSVMQENCGENAVESRGRRQGLARRLCLLAGVALVFLCLVFCGMNSTAVLDPEETHTEALAMEKSSNDVYKQDFRLPAAMGLSDVCFTSAVNPEISCDIHTDAHDGNGDEPAENGELVEELVRKFEFVEDPDGHCWEEVQEINNTALSSDDIESEDAKSSEVGAIGFEENCEPVNSALMPEENILEVKGELTGDSLQLGQQQVQSQIAAATTEEGLSEEIYAPADAALVTEEDILEVEEEIHAKGFDLGKKQVQVAAVALLFAVSCSIAAVYYLHIARSSKESAPEHSSSPPLPLRAMAPLAVGPISSSEVPAYKRHSNAFSIAEPQAVLSCHSPTRNAFGGMSRPAVELLSEFSITDAPLVKKDPSEMKVKNGGIAVSSRQSEEFIVEKEEKDEQGGGSSRSRKAAVSSSVTPLRRSSRLRNKATSP